MTTRRLQDHADRGDHDGALGRVTADAAYDTVGFYEAAGVAWRDRRGSADEDGQRCARYGPTVVARRDRTILAVTTEQRTATLEADWSGYQRGRPAILRTRS